MMRKMRMICNLSATLFLFQLAVNLAVLSVHAHSPSPAVEDEQTGLQNPVDSVEGAAAIPFSTTSHRGRIDMHVHFVPKWYKELLDARGLTAGGRAIPDWDATEHLALNAKLGIELSVLSISNPGVKFALDDPVEEGRELARKLNIYGRDLMEEYPGKFSYFATLTLPDVEGAVAEAIYALDNLKAAGIVVEASALGELFGTPRYTSLYKELNDRHAAVFIHPGVSPCPEISAKPETAVEATQGVPPFIADFLLDTVRVATNLVSKNVTTDYPDITFILSHAGGFLPFIATRAATTLAWTHGGVSDKLTSYYYEQLSKYHVDVAIAASANSLPTTASFFGTDSMFFGSDYPHAPPEFILSNTETLDSFQFSTEAGVGQGSGSSSSAHEKINYENAQALLGKLLSM